MMQEERDAMVKEFILGSTRVLVTTDLLAHRTNFQKVNLKINYDIPTCKETYIHRIGRTDRFGRK